MARGRPQSIGQDDKKLAHRREKVRLNVQAHRQRQKEKKRLEALNQPSLPSLRWISENERQALNSTCTPNQPGQPRSRHSHSRLSPARTYSLLYEPDPEKQYTLSLLGMFRTRFLPERVTLPHTEAAEERLTTPCALWILKGYQLAAGQESSVVTRILRAFGLAILAFEHQRDDIQAASMHAYHQTLAAISRQLSSITNGGNLRTADYLTLFISCHAAAIFQLNVNGSMARMFEHVRGLGSVLVHRSLQSDSVSKDWQDLADEYRLFEIVFCLIYRTPSILAGSSLFRHGKAVKGCDLKRLKTSQLPELVFIARHIPPIMAYIDELKAGKSSCDRRSEESHSAIECLSYILTELEQWFDNFADRNARAVVESEAYIRGHGDLEFPSLEVVSAWTFWLSFKLHALECYISIVEISQVSQQSSESSELSGCADSSNNKQSSSYCKDITDARSELLETVRLLNRSMPFHLDANIGYIGRSFVAFPLETARVALLHEFERESCMFPDAILLPVPDSADGRMQDIVGALKSCTQIAEKAKALRCALFSDQWPKFPPEN